MIKQKIALFLCMFSMVSCGIFSRPAIKDFPQTPKLEQYNRPPIIKKVDNDFLVTDQLIMNSTLLTDYYKRIELWKINKNIR